MALTLLAKQMEDIPEVAAALKANEISPRDYLLTLMATGHTILVIGRLYRARSHCGYIAPYREVDCTVLEKPAAGSETRSGGVEEAPPGLPASGALIDALKNILDNRRQFYDGWPKTKSDFAGRFFSG